MRAAWLAFAVGASGVLLVAEWPVQAEEQLASGEAVTVDLSGGKSRSCTFTHYSPGFRGDTRVRNLICPASGNQPALLIHEEDGAWIAAGTDAKGRILSPAVEGVSTANQLIYAARDPGVFKQDTLTAESLRINLIRSNLIGFNADLMRPVRGQVWPEESKKALDHLNQRVDERARQIRDAFIDSKDVVVEFGQGRRTTCHRGASTSGYRTQPCEFFVCDAVRVGDEVYMPVLSQGSDPASNAIPLVSARGLTSGTPASGLEVQAVRIQGTEVELYRKDPNARSLREQYGRILPRDFAMDDVFLASTQPSFRVIRSFSAKQCGDRRIEEHLRWEDDQARYFRNRLNQVDLAVVVDVVNGFLQSEVIPRSLLPEGVCHLEGDLYFTEAGFQKRHGGVAPSAPTRGILNEDEADGVFRKLAAMKDIPFGYAADGCYARAHIMAERLEKMGLHVEKVWAKGGSLRLNDKITWWYHVAPALWVRDKEGNLTRRVFDPSVTDRPVSGEGWVSRFHSDEKDGKSVKSGWPGPSDTSIYNRTQLYYSPWKIYDPVTTREPNSLELQATLQDARRTNAGYLDALGKLEAAKARATSIRPDPMAMPLPQSAEGAP